MSFSIFISLIFLIQAFFTNVHCAGNWTLTDETYDYTCLHLSADLNLFINYQQKHSDNFTTADIAVPSDARIDHVQSTCNYNATSRGVDNNEQILVLKFFDEKWSLKLKFSNLSIYNKPSSDPLIAVYQLELNYTMDQVHFPNARKHDNGTITIENSVNTTSGTGALKMFSSMNERSYVCQSTVNVTIVANQFIVQTANVSVEAFMPNSTRLHRPQYCSADGAGDKSDLIPIIIGAALAALVVIVLIVYLIGRARTKRTVYETI